MKNLIVTSLTLLSFTLSPALRADASMPVIAEETENVSNVPEENVSSTTEENNAAPAATPVAAPVEPVENSQNEIKQVSKPQNTGMSPAKKKQWQNIGLAIGAVVIAVVALILVSKNHGHKK